MPSAVHFFVCLFSLVFFFPSICHSNTGSGIDSIIYASFKFANNSVRTDLNLSSQNPIAKTMIKTRRLEGRAVCKC